MDARKLARMLGWVSLKIGLIEAVDPGGFGRRVGITGKQGLFRAYGVRELGTGLAILNAPDKEPWIWARVAGDVVDIATLAPAIRPNNPKRNNAALALALVLTLTVVDVACATALRNRKR